MLHSRGLRLAVVGALVPLVVPGLFPTTAVAGSEQEGDNSSEVDIDQNGEGGDAIAGSQVISVTGSGPTNIQANNNSRFARARGGDVKQNAEVRVDSGPRVRVRESSTDVSADAEGSATATQEATPAPATPNVGIRLEQVSTSTGDEALSSTTSATGVAAGTNGPREAGGSTNVLTTATTLGAGVQSTDEPDALTAEVNGVNSAEITGTAPLPQIATAFASPTDQSAAQSIDADVNNVVAPQVDVSGNNNAVVIGAAPVSQVSTVSASPIAQASAAPSRTRGRLFQRGDNDADADVSSALAGGDGIAGSNVIGVAGGGGATTIRATNSSDFAVGEGGDTQSDSSVSIANGPELTVAGTTSNVSANATGVADAIQTATPSVAVDLNQFTDPEGEIAVSNGVTTVTALDASNVAVGSGGPLSQSVSQSLFSSSNNTVAPQLSVIGSNAALVMSSAGVSQVADVQADPQASSELGGVP